MQTRVAVIFFGPISLRKERAHLASYNNEIVKKLYDKKILYQLFCLDFDGIEIKSDLVQVKQFSGSVYSKMAKLLHLLLGRIVGRSQRVFSESLFDLFVLRNIDFQHVDTLLFLRPLCPKVCLAARARGIYMFGVIATYSRKYIKQIIEKHEKKWKVEDKSDYSDQSRINEYDEVLGNWDTIISLTKSEVTKEVINNSLPYAHKVVYPKHEFGVDTSLFNFEHIYFEPPLRYLATTDDTLKKGLLVLLEAWSIFKEEDRSGASLTIVGNRNGATRKYITDSFNLTSVDFQGHVPDLHNYYKICHVYICPSIIDMGPRTVKQAMACGRMPIVSQQCGASDFVSQGVEGLIFDADESSSLAKAISWSANHPEKVIQMGAKAAEKAKQFDDNMFAQDIYDILTSKREQ